MTIAFPVTRPFVLAVQATGCACRGWTNGSRKRPWYETRSQPLPNSPHGSTLTFSKPHSRSFEAVHSFASSRSEEHTSELQSRGHLVCRLLLEKKNQMYVLV